MTDYKDTAFGAIRSFMWEKLQDYSILDSNDYIADGFIEPLIPIIPVQQVPEFNNLIGNSPYIVYSYDTMTYSDEWWICEEVITFNVVSNEFSKIVEISQFLVDLFRRMDSTAVDINGWQASTSKFKFFTFTLNSASSPAPYSEEGGRVMSQIEISYKYSRVLDSNGRFS